MEKPRFDHGADFSSLHPPLNGASFHQGEHYFGGNGDYVYSIDAEGTRYVVGAKAPAAAPTAPEPPKVPKIQQAAQARTAEATETGASINLDGWVKDIIKPKIPWFTVKKEIGLLHPDVDVSSAAKARAGLKAKGIGV